MGILVKDCNVQKQCNAVWTNIKKFILLNTVKIVLLINQDPKVEDVICHMSIVTCHMSLIFLIKFLFVCSFFGQNGGAS